MRHHLFYSLLSLLVFLLPVILSQSTPLLSKCDADLKPVFLLQHNVTNGVQLRVIPASNFLDCSEICALSNECVAAEFFNGVCSIIGESDKAFVSENEAAPLVSKSCVKSQRVCASPFHFDVHEQKILVGFAREVVPAESLQICLTACLNAFDTFGFECESVMYYPVDSECILNTEDRLDRPDLFVDEHEDTVIYLDNNCAGSQCYAPYITQYIAVEDSQLNNELDRQFADLDLEACEELCTHRLTVSTNDFNCKSFMYNSETRSCILSDERSTPLGRGRLTDAKGFTYYEKKCFASPRTCRNVPSFTRVPQMILVGFAAFVMENVPSVTMCLDQCTNPPPETGEKFVCKSVMYYYNEQECILNAETRFSKPDLFIPEGEEFQVDYFDITCHLEREECTGGRQLHSVRTLNAALPEGDGSLHVIESTGKSVSDCLAKCYEMAPEKCRSFNFDKESGLCNLLYLDGKTTLRPQIKQGIDLYDMHCLAPPSSCPLQSNGALFSRYLYSKQPGLPTDEKTVTSLTKCLDLCSTSARCEGVNYNRRNGQCGIFEQIDGNGEKHDHIDFYKNLCQVKEVDNGESSASNVPPSEFRTSSNKTILSHASSNSTSRERLDSRTELLSAKKIQSTIHEEEVRPRQYSGNSLVKQDSAAAAPASDSSANEAQASLSVGAASNSSSSASASLAPSVTIPAEAVHTICNYEGIKVQIKNSEPFSGVVFAKNKYDTCRVEVEFSDSATLVLGLPANFGMKPIVLNAAASVDVEQEAALGGAETGGAESAADGPEASVSANEIRRRREAARECGLIDMDNGTYKTTVVVQTNNLGIPGLVTSMDQLYEISCDYSSMLGGKITTAANLTVNGPEAALIQPKGKIELGNPVLMQMNAGDGGHQPIIQAKLGDILELRWEIMAMDEELDFFVKDCVAEPGGNEKRSDETLQLIQEGCPTPAVAQKLIPNPIQVQSSAVKIAHLQAFRFDSSSSVRITCHLEICKGDCQPVSCNLKDGAQQSWGRKKRESENSITMFETRRYKVPRFAQATTSLVVVDPLQQINEPSASVALSRHSGINLTRSEPPVSVHKIAVLNQMCVNKWTLFSVLGILLVLILVQSIVVSRYIFKRLWGSSKNY